jgi:hypothetical protein
MIRTHRAARPLALAACAALAIAAAPSTKTATGADSDRDLLDAKCSQFLDMLAAANPGTNPSPERQAEAKEAQKDAYQAMIWVHGYLSGKAHQGHAAMPLSRAWLVKMVPVVAAQCKKDPNAEFFTAVDSL